MSRVLQRCKSFSRNSRIEVRCSHMAPSVQHARTMVDFPKGEAMVEWLEDLPEKVQAIEQKLDALGTSVDARFDAVDARFDEVSAAFVEQREYTDFAFQELHSEMQSGFGRIERKLDMVIDRISSPPRTS
jgi:hypothetical protein